MTATKQFIEETHQHKWVEQHRKEVVVNYEAPGFFKPGMMEHGIKVVQQCEVCGLLNTIIY